MKILMQDVSVITCGKRTSEGETLDVTFITLTSGHDVTIDTGMSIDIVTVDKDPNASYILIEPLPSE